MAWDWDKLQQQKRSTGGGGGVPPQMGDVFNKIKGMRGRFPALWLIVIALFLIYLGSSCFYTVAVDEVGMIQRFGQYVRTTSPGLNFKLPSGIEKVTNVKVRFVYKEEFGFRTVKADVAYAVCNRRCLSERSPDAHRRPQRGCGALDCAVPHSRTLTSISSKSENVRNTLRDLSEAAMRLVVGDRSINEVISKREEIAVQAQELLQKELDQAETGITVTTIEMKRTNVPEPVQPSFNEVNQAGQEKEKMIYQAREEYNKRVPQARGDAEKTIKEAEGYALDRVNRAKGDASRFLSLYEEYVKADDVTRRRMYLEAMRDIMPKMGQKYIVDSDQKSLLPFLNLGRTKGGQQ